MEGRGDLFEPEYLTYRPCNPMQIRAYAVECLQPIVEGAEAQRNEKLL